MMAQSPLPRPTVIVPDTAPLIHLAAGDALHVLTDMGPVVVVDVVVLEATASLDKPYARQVAAWIEDGQQAGSNAPVTLVETELGALYRLALASGLKAPRNTGEIAIADWLADNLLRLGGPALVVYENGRVPNMLAREGVAATVAVATTRNLLEMAQEQGLIADAAAVWARISAAAPTANPASVLTVIQGDAP